ncbi:hypothetical protein EJ110_NYTH29300 [Nymphaea thermarum]|nr:hypothetical protein EJ110_NYTH29300 [Nymphaea thermarum]
MATVNPQWNAIASLVYVKLDENNYLLWKSQLHGAVYSQDLLRYVDGSFTPPPEKLNANSIEINPKYIKWKCFDQLALSLILSTLPCPKYYRPFLSYMISYSIKSINFNCLLLKSLPKLSLRQPPFSLNEEAMVVEETMAVVGLIVAEMVEVAVVTEGTLTLQDEALQGKRILKISSFTG